MSKGEKKRKTEKTDEGIETEQGEGAEVEEAELVTLDGSSGAGVPGGTTAGVITSPEDVAAWKLREEIKQLVQRMGDDLFSLCEKLYEVYGGMTYLKWGYKTWKDYVEEEVAFKLRKAQYYVSIWNWFGKLPETVREKVKALGWSKVSVLVGVVDEDNVDEWVAKAEKMTHEQLAHEAKKFLTPPEEKKESSGGADESVGRLTFVLFDEQKKVVEDALQHAADMAESDKRGHLLALICQDFLTTNSDERPSPETLLGRIERYTGIALIGVNLDEKKIVYGEKTLDKVIAVTTSDGKVA